jgi:hypothetical protein
MEVTPLPSTGPAQPRMSSRLPSTVNVSTRSLRCHLTIASLSPTTCSCVEDSESSLVTARRSMPSSCRCTKRSRTSWQTLRLCQTVSPHRHICYEVSSQRLGGILGKYCTHAYAHATKEGATALPSVLKGATALPLVLKGSEIVAYDVFRAHGVEVFVRSIMEHISKNLYLCGDEELATHNHVGKQFYVPVNTNVEWLMTMNFRRFTKRSPAA